MTDDAQRPIPAGAEDGSEMRILEEESKQAHHIMGRLRQIVGRVVYGEENDEGEIDDVLRQADAWIKAWRERRVTLG